MKKYTKDEIKRIKRATKACNKFYKKLVEFQKFYKDSANTPEKHFGTEINISKL